MNDFQIFLRTRRSIRRFKPDPVLAPIIERILETATYAPSAHNLQPWRFALVQTDAAKADLGKTLTEKMRVDMIAEGAPQSKISSRVERALRRIKEAPVIILLCRDVTAISKDDQEEVTMSVQSVAAAGLQLLQSAQSEGLSGNWICWPLYAQKVVQDALKLPETWEPQGMFILGYADEIPAAKKMKSLAEVVINL